MGRAFTSGRCNTRSVRLTICMSLLPVVVAMFLGFVRTSKTMLRCSHGTRKWVPSLMTASLTPDRRSKMTALEPPLTSYMDACSRPTPTAAGTAAP